MGSSHFIGVFCISLIGESIPVLSPEASRKNTSTEPLGCGPSLARGVSPRSVRAVSGCCEVQTVKNRFLKVGETCRFLNLSSSIREVSFLIHIINNAFTFQAGQHLELEVE